MQLIDSHCHLDDDRFDARRAAVLRDAADAGIERIVVPATTAARWEKLRRVCAQRAGLFPAYGLHPWFCGEHRREHLDRLDAWLAREKPVALGECGLDFYHSRNEADWQTELFTAQLELARDHRLPVIVHARKALDEVIALLRRHRDCRGVLHSFVGSEQQARQLYDLGFRIGIAASVSFERARKLRAVVTSMPDDALLLESDAPDQPGAGHRGELNQPAFIVEHLRVMAELRDTDADSLAATLNRNAETLFGI
jgi:TatD DNase family protein